MLRLVTLLLSLALFAPSIAMADTKIALDRRDCALLTRHVPSADVAYTPGVDVEGRKVVPADLGGGANITLPDRIEFPITIDLGDRLGIPVHGDADYIARFPVGTVAVGPDGRVTFNGVPLTDEDSAELAARCQRIERDR